MKKAGKKISESIQSRPSVRFGKTSYKGYNRNQSPSLLSTLISGDIPDGEDANEIEERQEYRYRYHNERYYYDRRNSDSSGSLEDSKIEPWQPGLHYENYVVQRDNVLHEKSGFIIKDACEEGRTFIGGDRTYNVHLKDLTPVYETEQKPLFEIESFNEKQGRIYLVRHKILELIHNMTTLLLVERPEHPKQWIQSHLETLMAIRDADDDATQNDASRDDVPRDDHAPTPPLPRVFDDGNIRAVFGMIEPTGRKETNEIRYSKAMQAMGIDKCLTDYPTQHAPGATVRHPHDGDCDGFPTCDGDGFHGDGFHGDARDGRPCGNVPKNVFLEDATQGAITQAKTFFRHDKNKEPEPDNKFKLDSKFKLKSVEFNDQAG